MTSRQDRQVRQQQHMPDIVVELQPKLRRPGELVDERLRLVEAWRPGGLLHAIAATSSAVVGDREAYAAHERETIAGASLWWVTADMCDLVAAAMCSVPDSTVFDLDLPVDDRGVCYFETTLMMTDAASGERNCPVDAVVWGPQRVESADGNSPRLAVSLSSYTWSHGRLMPLGRSDWLAHTTVTDTGSGGAGGIERANFDASAVEDRRLVAALWLLSSQPGVADTTITHAERAVARRAQRCGHTSEIRIVKLRGQDDNTDGSDRDGSTPGRRQASVRTIVSGHWRNQAYGPGHAYRRPVWISPHLRGPDSAPLRIRPTVKILDSN